MAATVGFMIKQSNHVIFEIESNLDLKEFYCNFYDDDYFYMFCMLTTR